MGYNMAGNRVEGVIVQAIQQNKQVAQRVVQQAINDVKSDPAKNIRAMQQPSGLSIFLDIKI